MIVGVEKRSPTDGKIQHYSFNKITHLLKRFGASGGFLLLIFLFFFGSFFFFSITEAATTSLVEILSRTRGSTPDTSPVPSWAMRNKTAYTTTKRKKSETSIQSDLFPPECLKDGNHQAKSFDGAIQIKYWWVGAVFVA